MVSCRRWIASRNLSPIKGDKTGSSFATKDVAHDEHRVRAGRNRERGCYHGEGDDL